MNKVDRSEDRQYRSINRCVGHHLIDCQWVQIIDLTLLLTTPHQTQLLEMFPFLRKYVDKPQGNINYTLSWIDLEKEVQQMDPTIFKISRISRSQRTRSNKKQTCSIPISNKYIIPNRHNRTEKLTPSCDPKKELSRRNRRDDWPAGPLREIHAPSKHILCQCRGTMQVHCGPGALWPRCSCIRPGKAIVHLPTFFEGTRSNPSRDRTEELFLPVFLSTSSTKSQFLDTNMAENVSNL